MENRLDVFGKLVEGYFRALLTWTPTAVVEPYFYYQIREINPDQFPSTIDEVSTISSSYAIHHDRDMRKVLRELLRPATSSHRFRALDEAVP
jgi:hypothetical protein